MYDHVLVPIASDGGARAERALAVARRLAGGTGRLTALTVLEAIPSYVAVELPEDVLPRSRELAEANLRGLVGEGVESVVVTGHAARTINAYAETHGVDCIVVASHQPGLSDYVLGSTAAQVVRHAHCSVHVVR